VSLGAKKRLWPAEPPRTTWPSRVLRAGAEKRRRAEHTGGAVRGPSGNRLHGGLWE
jgi:hypothetical protein